MQTIPEKDWKILRALKNDKLVLICEKFFAQAKAISKNRKDKEHESFLRLWDEIHKANADIKELCDDTRRSNAIFKLIAWKQHGLLSDAELSSFSEATREMLIRF